MKFRGGEREWGRGGGVRYGGVFDDDFFFLFFLIVQDLACCGVQTTSSDKRGKVTCIPHPGHTFGHCTDSSSSPWMAPTPLSQDKIFWKNRIRDMDQSTVFVKNL